MLDHHLNSHVLCFYVVIRTKIYIEDIGRDRVVASVAGETLIREESNVRLFVDKLYLF